MPTAISKRINGVTAFITRIYRNQRFWPKTTLLIQMVDASLDIWREELAERASKFGVVADQRGIEFKDIQAHPQGKSSRPSRELSTSTLRRSALRLP